LRQREPDPTLKGVPMPGNRKTGDQKTGDLTAGDRKVHLAAHFPGVNNTTVWADPTSGSHIDFSSFDHLARTAEEGLFDFLFLAEGLRLREHKGKIFDLDVVGRPETATVLAAVAAVTRHLGVVGTFNSTFNEPYDLARTLATLDRVSGGRAAWNVVTTHNAFTGENFRRGGYLDGADRYRRAEEFVTLARRLWESGGEPVDWTPGAGDSGTPVTSPVHGTFPVPRTPQVDPVIFQAGDSPEGRDFAARNAEVIFTRHGTPEEGRAFRRDLDSRLARFGRTPDSLRIFPAVTVVLGDTTAEAQERAREISLQQVSGPGAIAFLEQVWGRDLTSYDPDGPLPDIDPVAENVDITRGRVRHHRDPAAVAGQWRELAAAKNLSIRELVIEVSARQSFVGTAVDVAEELIRRTRDRVADGFILVPHLTPHGIDDVVRKVVPVLQDRGAYRTSYEGETLRENLGLPPLRPLTGQDATPATAHDQEIPA
jgi:alkanesulfonate monooxygenase SsuD/methylene tetrahydromethanopterin reductase-like flavin-dependent oxidoreductase (luciferase family)